MASHERWMPMERKSVCDRETLVVNDSRVCVLESRAFVFVGPAIISPWILIRCRSKRSWILISFLLSDSSPTIFTDSLFHSERQKAFFSSFSLAFFRFTFFPPVVNCVRRKAERPCQTEPMVIESFQKRVNIVGNFRSFEICVGCDNFAITSVSWSKH